MDQIAKIVGYFVMGIGAGALLTAALGVLMHHVWRHVIRPVHLLADYQQWRRAKAQGLWQWPEIISKRSEDHT